MSHLSINSNNCRPFGSFSIDLLEEQQRANLNDAIEVLRSGLVPAHIEAELDNIRDDSHPVIEAALVAELDDASFNAYFGTGRFFRYPDRHGIEHESEMPAGRVKMLEFDAAQWLGFKDKAAAGSSAEPFKVNDALFIGGDLPEKVLNLEVKLGFGRGRDDRRWPCKAMPFSALLGLLSKHEVGEKDGKALIQGTAIGNERKAKAMEGMWIAGLDLDSGIFPEPIAHKIQNELGLTSIIYTTHSHNSTETHVVQNSFSQWARKHHLDEVPTTGTMRRYMQQAKKWEGWVCETIELADEPVHTKDGISYVLTHSAMPKFRVIFPLAEPFIIAKQKLSQQEAINLWKGRVLGLAKILGVPIDESCLDPSRLFYLSRHREGRDFQIIVTSGEALDFNAVPAIMPRAKDRPDDDVFVRAAKELGGSMGALMIGDFNLKAWSAQVAQSFDVVEMFRQVAPNKVRTDYNTEKLEIECPYDYEHGNAGDTDDRGAWVQSAHADDSDSGFQWGCRHNCCSGRKRLDFLAEAVEQGWFKVEDLTNDRFRIFTTDDAPDHESVIADALEKIETVQSGAKAAFAVEAILKEIAGKGLPATKIKMVGDVAVKKRLLSASTLTEIVKALRREIATAQLEKESKESGRVQILDDEDHTTQVAKATTAWTAYNTKTPRIYRGVEGLVRAETNVVTSIPTLTRITPAIMRHELLNAVRYIETKESREGAVAREIVEDILARTNLDVPVLKGIVTTPFFTKTAGGIRLVATPGYHAGSQHLYLPSPGLKVPAVSAEPATDELARAKDLLLDNVYVDFPFDDVASRAHVICMLLQPFMRDVIAGQTPGYFISKPSAGTGAGLLVNATMLIAHGAPGDARTESGDEDERRKGILAALRSGSPYFWLDNIHADLDSAAYASAITSGFVTGRILGASDEVRLPVKHQWVFSGNNPRASGELVRRFVPIFMDAKGDPTKRTDFKHKHLETWVRENRSDLVWACLTLIQAWIAAGAKLDHETVLPSFEGWSATFGGLLKVIGIEGFLTNLEKLKEAADTELDVWGALATAWVECSGLKVKRPVGSPDGDGPWDGKKALLSVIAERNILIDLGGKDERGHNQSLMRALHKRKGSVISATVDGSPCDLILHVGRDTGNSAIFWLERAQV